MTSALAPHDYLARFADAWAGRGVDGSRRGERGIDLRRFRDGKIRLKDAYRKTRHWRPADRRSCTGSGYQSVTAIAGPNATLSR
ncbi:hypothetical protein ACIBXA_30590 [Micromonospora echinaurantiaca]|uniref:hypothetical protein n=1 Tax=Micromonospora echinaurantiaca TaxID=47857 RepID=UPI0037975AE0